MTKLLLGIITVSTCTISHAAIYKWLDENGNAQFSDEPPKQGNYTTLDIPTSPAFSSSPNTESFHNQVSPTDTELLKKRQAEQELAQKQQELQNECLRAKDYLETIKNAKIYDLNAQGERVYKSERQHDLEIKRVEQSIKRHCP